MWVWVMTTCRIDRCSAMLRARVMAPASTATQPSMRNEVIRQCRAVAPEAAEDPELHSSV